MPDFLEWAEGQQGVGFVAAGLFPERYEKTALMLLPPTLIEEYAWEKQKTSASTARTAMQAIEAFLLKYESHHGRQVIQVKTDLYNRVLANITACRNLTKQERSRLEQLERPTYEKNREQKQRDKALETRPAKVLELMRGFLRSDYLQSWCEDISDHIRNRLAKNDVSATTVRDAALALLLLTMGGHRGLEIQNMTVKEWCSGEVHAQGRIVHVHKHKTFSSHGPAPIIVSRSFVDSFIQAYLDHVRPLFATGLGETGDIKDSANPLFLSARGKGLAHEKQALVWMRIKMLRAGLSDPFDPELKTLTTTAIRKCWSTLGQACTDPSLREAIPRVMMHSGDTARQHYDQSGPDNIRKVARHSSRHRNTCCQPKPSLRPRVPPPRSWSASGTRPWSLASRATLSRGRRLVLSHRISCASWPVRSRFGMGRCT